MHKENHHEMNVCRQKHEIDVKCNETKVDEILSYFMLEFSEFTCLLSMISQRKKFLLWLCRKIQKLVLNQV